jgi:hypothetical protein
MKYRIKENKYGNFTIFEFEKEKNWWGRDKEFEKRLFDFIFLDSKLTLNGNVKSYEDCIRIINKIKDNKERILIDKIVEI